MTTILTVVFHITVFGSLAYLSVHEFRVWRQRRRGSSMVVLTELPKPRRSTDMPRVLRSTDPSPRPRRRAS